MYIKAKGLRKQYGEGTGVVQALKGVDVNAEKGEMVAIIGPSGSGKTTLLNCIGAAEEFDAGEVIVGDYLLNILSKKDKAKFRRNKIGFVYRDHKLLNDLTVGQNIDIGAFLGHDNINYDVMMKVLGLTEMQSLYPAQISPCQRQCCMVARALMKGADVLLLDEPIGTLDTRNTKAFLTAMEEINRKFDITILLATHNEAVKPMMDRIITMKDGLVVDSIKNEEKIYACNIEEL